MNRISIACLSIITLLSLNLNAQHYNFIEYSVPDGLIHSTVTTITEDSRGYLWMGTYDGGLSQFDGKRFVNYSEGELFAGHYIEDVESDKDGTIWIASSRGLSRFDGREFTSYTDSSGLTSSRVKSLLFDSKNKFWIGTSKGINFLKNDSIYAFAHNDKFEHPSIHSMIETKDKGVIIGTWKGIYIYNNDKLDSLKTYGTDSIGVVYCLKQDSRNDVWFGTHYGIGRYDGKNVERFEMKGNTGQNIIESIEEDRNGNMWFATRGGGVFVYDGHEFKNINDKNGLSSNGLFSVFKDSNDVMWVGGGGLNKYTEGFFHLSTNHGLVHDVVFPIVEDQRGDMWFGTEGGLSHYYSKTKKVVNYTIEDGLTANGITSILETKSGDIWVTTQSGLNKLVNGKFIQHPKYKETELWTLTEGENGEIWIGGSFGLVKERRLNESLYESISDSSGENSSTDNPEIPNFIKNSQSSEYFSESNGFVDDAVYSMAIDDEANLWFGTIYSGVFKYKNGRFEKFDTKNGLKSNNILRMKSDGKGGMWIGTNNGLSHYHNGEMRTYTLEDGLWMDMIFNVVVDDEHLWIGGTKGIQKLTFDENGDIIKESKFGEHEGFRSIETNDGGGLKDSKGNLWFGTIGGATMVDPNHISYATSATRIHITDIKLFLEDIDWSLYTDSVTNWYRLPKSVELAHDKNQLTFEFDGINLKVPEKIKYQWKLDGFDKDWSPVTTKRDANYTNLPPGDYNFIVRASNEAGIWSLPANLSFKIAPPFWQRWWFILLASLVFVMMVWGFIKYRLLSMRRIAVAQNEMVNIERKMIESERKALRAQINPHFIFNVLNSIQFYIQDNEPLVASRHLSKFAKLMRMILENSKSSAVPISDELESLRLYMDLEILRTEYKFDYKINVDEAIDVSDCMIPPMLIQPFVENAIRHGIIPSPNNGRISLGLKLENDVITCVIEDNGVGINLAKKNKGGSDHISSGMQITGDRLEILNMQRSHKMNINIVDLEEEGLGKKGTRIEIFIPLEH